MKGPLRRWNREVFGHIALKIKVLSDEMLKVDHRAQLTELQDVDWHRREALQSQLRLWLSRKERYWKQMSRCKILQDGDKNTRYFHMLATIRRRKQLMDKILIQGNLVTELNLIKKAIVDHFKQLYTKQSTTKFDISILAFQDYPGIKVRSLLERSQRKKSRRLC